MAIGPWQILVVIVLLLLLFGAGRLSEIGKGLGSGIRNFREGLEGDDDEGATEGATAGAAGQGKSAPKSLPGSTGAEQAPEAQANAAGSPADGGASEVSAARKQPPNESA